MKKSEQAYYNKYFETNWNNIKSTWKGIKSLISLKSVASSAPTMPSCNGNTVAETTKDNLEYSHKHFSDI